MSKTFYTSDTHFGHENIIRYSGRPFSSVEEMNSTMIENWNSLVGPDDTVWHLGDVVMNVKWLHSVSQLNGQKILVAGNHDHCWAGFKKPKATVHDYIDAGFQYVITNGILIHTLKNNREVVLSHLPYEGNQHDGRKFEGWRPRDTGLVNLCGHVHEAWKIQGRSINVGVDQWDFKPVAEETLVDLIATL